MKSPSISVITAVYNGEKHLEQCIESIRAQTFPDYEHIIVNDGSTDATGEILERWQKRDPRIRIINNAINKGRSLSRNRAITAARAPLLAILDADDYSAPDRLSSQHAFLEQNPEVNILGADMQIHGTDKILSHPRENDEIRADLFFDSSLFHSTVMMRKCLLTAAKSFYDAELPLAQDYGLWAALMFRKQSVFANLPETLTFYRLPENPRPGYEDRQFNYANIVRGRILRHIGLEGSRHNLACHLGLLYGNAGALGTTPADCAAWGRELAAANRKTPIANPEALDRQIAERMKRILLGDMLTRGQTSVNAGSKTS